MIRSIDGHYHRHERHCRPPDRLSTSRPSDVSIAREPKSEGPLEKIRIFSITLHRVDGRRRDIERTVRTSVIRRRYVILAPPNTGACTRVSHGKTFRRLLACVFSFSSLPPRPPPVCLFLVQILHLASSFLPFRTRTHARARTRVPAGTYVYVNTRGIAQCS